MLRHVLRMALSVRAFESIEAVDQSVWDTCVDAQDPCTEHAFLAAFERSGCVDASTGWNPFHLEVTHNGEPVAFVPGYLKTHSYGEFIFDFQWASAAERVGFQYYPKYVSAVPFTPVTGPRILVMPSCGADNESITAAIAKFLDRELFSKHVSSYHALFVTEGEAQHWQREGALLRHSMQYHWSNFGDWKSWDEMQADMRSVARKQIRKERAQANAYGLRLQMVEGPLMDDIEWDALYTFYTETIDKNYSSQYLNRAFFQQLRQHFSHRVVASFAYDGARPVAGAFFLKKGKSLYGRYWGALRSLPAMHFELCYYLPMEWGLSWGMQRFEAGAQGEHKIKRGLVPNFTYSVHNFKNERMKKAVGFFLEEEYAHLTMVRHQLEALSPFKSS